MNIQDTTRTGDSVCVCVRACECASPHQRWWYPSPSRWIPLPLLSGAAQIGARTPLGASTAPAAAAAFRCPPALAGIRFSTRRLRFHLPLPNVQWHHTGRRNGQCSCSGSISRELLSLVRVHWTVASLRRFCSWHLHKFHRQKFSGPPGQSSVWTARPGHPPGALGVPLSNVGLHECWFPSPLARDLCNSASDTEPEQAKCGS